MNLEHYNTALNRAALIGRNDRGLIELTGDDRAKWLGNLVTNVVATLQPGEGNYAFVVNVKGRTQFDLNLLVRPDRILLDIDLRWVEPALKLFDRYIITEDVRLADISDQIRRTAVIGPEAHVLSDRLALGNLAAMPWLQNVEGRVGDQPVLMFRHDDKGLPGAEFLAFGSKAAAAIEAVEQVAANLGFPQIDAETANTLRIEAGIPASVDDIDEEVIPPETGQIERGISYHKGCYLGQEVIERMRAHKVLARRLVGVRFENDAPLPRLSPLTVGDHAVGRTLSGCISPALGGAPLSLAYVKTSHAAPGTPLRAQVGERACHGEIVPLPIRQS